MDLRTAVFTFYSILSRFDHYCRIILKKVTVVVVDVGIRRSQANTSVLGVSQVTGFLAAVDGAVHHYSTLLY